MKMLSRLVCCSFLSLLIAALAHADIVKPPRGGLFGVSRQSHRALHAINQIDGTGAEIGEIFGLVPSALAREPASGILVGFGNTATDVRMAVIDQRSGALLDQWVVTTDLDPGESIAWVSAADFATDGTLYVNIGILDSATTIVDGYLATVVVDAGFAVATRLGAFPTNLTGISFDDDGILWGVSPAGASAEADTLYKFADAGGEPNPSSSVSFALTDGTNPPPGAGFASLQFTCDSTLYAGNLETVTNIVEIQATYVAPSGKYSNFTINYDDLDGDLQFDVDTDEVVSFSGVSKLKGGTRSWNTLIGAPDVPGVSVLSGYHEGDTDLWWFDGTSPDTGLDAADWTYTVAVVGPSFHGDGGYLFTIETSSGAEGTIALVASPPVSATGGAGLSGFAVQTICNTTSVQNSPTPAGDLVTAISIEPFEQEISFVDVAGETTANFCVSGNDPRERGVDRRGRDRYQQRYLNVSELSFTGSCGDLSHIDLRIGPQYRGFEGELNGVPGVRFVIALIDTSAEANGPVVYLPFPEALIDYSGRLDPGSKLACSHDDLTQHPWTLGAPVAAFGDFPNVEGSEMLPDTAQCDGLASMTRRSGHAYPVRLDVSSAYETIHLQTLLNGLSSTILEAYNCVADSSVLDDLRDSLQDARSAQAQERWVDLILLLEQIARDAKNGDFSGCQPDSAGNYRNYKGNFMSRALVAAFDAFDRLYLPSEGLAWTEYRVPDDLEVPLLLTRPFGTPPYWVPPSP